MQKNLKDLFENDPNLDPKSVDVLVRALEKNYRPGFDYIEFKQSLTALAAMNIDENVAVRSAFATASTVGLTKEKLLESAAFYSQVFANEKKQFDEEVSKRLEGKVGGKLKEMENLKEQIKKHRERITQLEEQINNFQNTIDKADGDILAEKIKIENTQANFSRAYEKFQNQIEQDVVFFKQYL